MDNPELIIEFAEYISENGLDPSLFERPPLSVQDVEKIIKRSPASLKLLDGSKDEVLSILTKSNFSIIESLTKDVNSVLQKTGNSDLIGNIIYCECPIYDFNACALRLESGYVVMLNSGLFRFLGKYSKIYPAIAGCLESTVDEKKRNEGLGITTTTLALLILNSVGVIPDKLVGMDFIDKVSGYSSWDEAHFNFRMNFLRSVELFVLFHEISHITCGHLTSKNILSAHSDGRPSIGRREHKKEFEADIGGIDFLTTHYGADLVQQYFELSEYLAKNDYEISSEELVKFDAKVLELGANENPEIFFGSVLAFFFVADLFDFTYKELGLSTGGTHPSPQERMDNFESHFRNNIATNKLFPIGVTGFRNTIDAISDPTKKLLSFMIKQSTDQSGNFTF